VKKPRTGEEKKGTKSDAEIIREKKRFIFKKEQIVRWQNFARGGGKQGTSEAGKKT